jgi:hypothetical protein
MPSRVDRALKIGLYALLYAVAVALLVIFAPGEPQVFIYQEF